MSAGVSKKDPSYKMGKNMRSPSMEPQKAYVQWGVAWFPKGIVNGTALSLPQCHAALSTILSTFAWVDQSPVSQPVS